MNRLTRYALGLLVEEMGEALQMIGKALRFGLDAPGPDRAPYFGKTARQILPIELGDVRAAMLFGGHAGLYQAGRINVREGEKISRLLEPGSRDSGGGRLAPDPYARLNPSHWVEIYVLDERTVRVPHSWAHRFRAAELEDLKHSSVCSEKWDARNREFEAFEKALSEGLQVEDY